MLLSFVKLVSLSLGACASFFCCANGSKTNNHSTTEDKESDTTVVIKRDTVECTLKPNSVYTLKKDVDLEGKVYKLPEGITIKQKKGTFRNGVIIGNNTKIEAKSALFDKVTITGTWNVPEISTDLFKDLSYVNSLKDVMALSDKDIDNTIYIAPGKYNLRVDRNNQSCLTVCSNTKLKIDGDLYLEPNSFKNYNIVDVSGQNAHLSGKGSINGDRDAHTGTEGEWGMGIRITNSTRTSVTGLSVKDCWGDCIYVRGNCTDITIKDCTLRNSRRQGISVISGKNITIEDCCIYDINGTNPMFAIDVEPNKTDVVDSVFIRRVKSFNCVGGIMCTRSTVNPSLIGYVEITDCDVRGIRSYSYRFKGSNKIVLQRCKGSSGRIEFWDTDNIVVEDNLIDDHGILGMYRFVRCNNIQRD